MPKFFKSTFQYCALSIVFLFPFFSSYASSDPLKVGVYPCPPFVISSMEGEWSGLSVELWEQIAKEMDVEYTLETHRLDDLLNSIETEQIDVGVSCISITPERELFADFSHSFTKLTSLLLLRNRATCKLYTPFSSIPRCG